MKALYWLVVVGVALYAGNSYFRGVEYDKIADKGNADLETLIEKLRREPPADLRAWNNIQEAIRHRQESRSSYRKDAEEYHSRASGAAAVAGTAALTGITWEVLKRRRRNTRTPPDIATATQVS